MKLPRYIVRESLEPPQLRGEWERNPWKDCEIISVDNFRNEGSEHRPETKAKVLYNSEAIYCIFRVDDRYVRCVHTEYQDEVWKDSCVEIFLQPDVKHGYFNFEVNCGGAIRCAYNEIIMGKPKSEKRTHHLPPSWGKQVELFHSLPSRVFPELEIHVEWIIEVKIPFLIFEHHIGKQIILADNEWRANFYKCGDETSHPHWASWASVKELNFHRPEDFGILKFENSFFPKNT